MQVPMQQQDEMRSSVLQEGSLAFVCQDYHSRSRWSVCFLSLVNEVIFNVFSSLLFHLSFVFVE